MSAAAVPDAGEVQVVGGVPFRMSSLQHAVKAVISLSLHPAAVNFRFLNAWNVALAQSDPEYRRLLVRRGINFPDGTPVVWVMRMRRRRSGDAVGHVRGPTFFHEVMRQGVAANVRHYLLGGTPETLDVLVRTLTAKYDGIRIVGAFAPRFAPVTGEYLDECLRRIRPCKPDLVWIGLGTPKQDYVGDELCKKLGVPVLGVGAAFDFAAGTKREAPVWMQRCGLEWLSRLLSEPRRLWRRYLWGNLRFITAVFLESALRDAPHRALCSLPCPNHRQQRNQTQDRSIKRLL